MVPGLAPFCPPAFCQLTACASRVRRAVDPTRLTERIRRNEIPEEDLHVEMDYLIFGVFKADEDDEGFKATRWVSGQEALKADDFEKGLNGLDELLAGARTMLLEDDEGDDE